MKTIKFILLISLFRTLRAEAEFSPLLPTQTIIKNNWKNLRDLSVVKQNFESSCGGASLATLLTFYYGQTVSEADILKALENNGKKAVSFSEMQKILPQFGFQGQGYAAGYEQLKQLKIPVVVYIKLFVTCCCLHKKPSVVYRIEEFQHVNNNNNNKIKTSSCL